MQMNGKVGDKEAKVTGGNHDTCVDLDTPLLLRQLVCHASSGSG